MRAESFDGARERDVLSSVIWDTGVLNATVLAYAQSKSLFQSDLANYVLGWVVNYYDKYRVVPGDDVRLLPGEVRSHNEDLSNQLANFISSLTPPLSTNSDRLIDIATKYYDLVNVGRLADKVKALASSGNVQGCVDSIIGFKRIETGANVGINPITDDTAILSAFQDNSSVSLLKFKGDDETQFFGDTFSRGSFVVFNAAEKAGKSTMLLELALMAVFQGYRVAYFEAGDMNQAQVIQRIYRRLAKHPKKAGSVRIPLSIDIDPSDYRNSDKFKVEFKTKVYDDDMSGAIALQARDKWLALTHGAGTYWKFSAHPTDLSVPQIHSILDEWERTDDFIADFIIIDYADLLVPATKTNEFRHQINDTFSRLRGLSLDKKCCLITATQASGAGWNAEVMTRKHLAEDKRKAAHPTAIIGLSSSDNERQKQLVKLNYLVRRDDVCNENDCLYLAQSLAIGCPMVRTCFPAWRHASGLGKQSGTVIQANKAGSTNATTATNSQLNNGLVGSGSLNSQTAFTNQSISSSNFFG